MPKITPIQLAMARRNGVSILVPKDVCSSKHSILLLGRRCALRPYHDNMCLISHHSRMQLQAHSRSMTAKDAQELQ